MVPGGPIYPYSVFVVTGAVFGQIGSVLFVGSGVGSKQEEGLGISGQSLVEESYTWRLRFQMPPELPTGTAKLRLLGLAVPTVASTMVVQPKWASVAAGEDPSAAVLNDEGTSNWLFAVADNDVYKELKITLDADTVMADEIIVMDLVFPVPGRDFPQQLTFWPMIWWE